MTAQYSVIGTRQKRKEAWAKTSGSAHYTADLAMADLTFGALTRSPHHHARILAIDPTTAQAMPGVIAVITAADVPGSRTFGGLVPDQPALAFDEVRHMGEPVALVVADTREQAQAAARQVRVQYEELPAVFDPVAALQPGSPLVQTGGNLLSRYDVSDGSLDEGFAEAEVVIEETFSVHRVAPSYMEPENSLARCNPDGTLTVWVSSQKPFEDRKAIAAVLGLPVEQVQVISAVIGGAFGGREDSSLSILTALAAWLTHGNVRIVNNRSDSFLAHPKRHPAQIHLKIGAKRDGTLTALHGVVHMDTGAYASYGPAVGGLLTEVVPGPYRIPNVRVETNVVYTHSPYSGAMRGFGSPQAHFAIESCMNMLAERLGMDPLALRRKNILHPGDHLYTRVQLNNTALGLEGCLNAAEEVRKWMLQIEPTPGKVSGVGVALGMQTMGLGAKVPDISSHRMEWLPDGRVMIYLGATDLGQGLATVAEQMVAEALDLPFEMVISQPVDTRISADGGVTCASRMTYLVGNALVAGAAKLRECLLETAAREMHVSRDSVLYERGQVALPNSKRFPAATFARLAAEHGERLRIETSAEFPYPPETTPQHLPIGMPHTKAFFAAQVVRVEVDPELGSVEVKDVVAIHDLGRVINPAAAEGQVEGGVAMGIGYALYEDMFRKPDGRWVDSFTEYLLPTARDVPENLEVIFLEVPEESGPYGAKGVAEITLVPTAPAIAEAVYNAVHVRVQDLPITPEKLIQL